ncbi:MAG: hypothetical protein KY455_01765 [Euryarchaeota archaeon]|nr:hypothetical protein [Euryarchaeota archaeon]
MNNRLLALITALALAGLGVAAIPVLADAHDSEACQEAKDAQREDPNPVNRERVREACQPAEKAPEERCAETDNETAEERCEERAAGKKDRENAHGFRDERHDARDAFHSERDEARHGYHAEKARLRAEYDRSNETQREEFLERQKAAREAFKAAQERAREKYHDRLQSAREAYVSERGEDGKCAEDPDCVDARIAALERRKADAEKVKLHLENKSAAHEAEAADNNTTKSEQYRAKDRALGLQIAILQMERHILRIDAKLDHWYAVKEGTATGDEPESDTSDDTTDDTSDESTDDTGDDTTDDTSDESTDDTGDGGSGNETA